MLNSPFSSPFKKATINKVLVTHTRTHTTSWYLGLLCIWAKNRITFLLKHLDLFQCFENNPGVLRSSGENISRYVDQEIFFQSKNKILGQPSLYRPSPAPLVPRRLELNPLRMIKDSGKDSGMVQSIQIKVSSFNWHFLHRFNKLFGCFLKQEQP